MPIIYPKLTKDGALHMLHELQQSLETMDVPLGIKAGKGGDFYVDLPKGFSFKDVDLIRSVVESVLNRLGESPDSNSKLLSQIEGFNQLFGYQTHGFPFYFNISPTNDIYVWMLGGGRYSFEDAALVEKIRSSILAHVKNKITEVNNWA